MSIRWSRGLPQRLCHSHYSIYHAHVAIDVDMLRIRYWPAPVLKRKAEAIPVFTDEVAAVAERMIELMHEARGVGLAAPQVGLSWRLFVANATTLPEDDLIFINPVLRDPSDETDESSEGCLSLPDVTVQVTRPKAITIEAYDISGKPFALESDDLPARIWQHEFDHLEGVLILDRMSPMDQMSTKKVLQELEQDYKSSR
jgi:peptide deformylase